MTPMELCIAIREGLPALFECTPAPMEGVRVRTPMMYPDGSVVDVFVLDRGGDHVVTDFGTTLSWLRTQSARGSITSKQQGMIEDVCRSIGVERHNGQLVLRCAEGESLADSLLLLSQAAVRVSDVWFTFPSYSTDSERMATAARARMDIATEVNSWLREQRLEAKRSIKYLGLSSREWNVDYEINAKARTSLVFLLSAGSRAKAQQVAEHVLAGCIDLSYLRETQPQYTLISLFDDRRDIWEESDFALVGGHSEVARWSYPREFRNLVSSG